MYRGGLWDIAYLLIAAIVIIVALKILVGLL